MYFCFKVTQTKPPKNSYFFINFCFQVAGNIGLINPLIFNHFGYGTYAQVAYKLLLLIPKSLFHFFFSVVVNQYFSDHIHVLPHLPRVAVGRFQNWIFFSLPPDCPYQANTATKTQNISSKWASGVLEDSFCLPENTSCQKGNMELAWFKSGWTSPGSYF